MDRRRFYPRACAIAAGLGIAAASAAAGPSETQWAEVRPAVRHAKGSFEAAVKPESETRFAMTKTFTGAMVGTSKGTMIGGGVITAYAALEKFEGALDGRKGSFVMLHRGYMTNEEGMNLDIAIAPNSGTGELSGVSGKLIIEIKGGKHLYDLAYSLPPE